MFSESSLSLLEPALNWNKTAEDLTVRSSRPQKERLRARTRPASTLRRRAGEEACLRRTETPP
jgi:hypothetical protein